jgi:hypothetical protein
MNFEWDENKNQLNQQKHGLNFELAQLVFNDPLQLTKFDRIVDGEERWHTLGSIGGMSVILVVHLIDDQHIRIISARKATKQERQSYEQFN